MKRITFVGTGPGDPLYCTRIGLLRIQKASCLIGSEELLERFRPEAPLDAVLIPWPKGLKAMQDTILKAAETYREVTVLATGDSNRYSIAGYFYRTLKEDQNLHLELIPGISSLQYFAAKLRLPLDEVQTISLHGRMKGFSIERLAQGGHFIFFTEPEHGPKFLAETFKRMGLAHITLVVGEALSLPEEKITRYQVGELQDQDFHELSLVYAYLPVNETPVVASEDAFPLRRFGLPDTAFLRGDRPMTKQATRLLALSLLDLPAEGVFWDIGAGTGSVALEVARALPKQNVFGIEKEAEGIRLLNENKARFALKNLDAVHGRASDVLSNLPFCHRAFIGGSAGEMEQIFELLEQGFLREVEKQNLLHDPLWIGADRCLKLCVSAVTLTTPVRAMEAAKRHGFRLQQSLLLNVAQGQTVGSYVLDRAENPVRLLFFERRES